ncbi:hypothetical protein C0J52_12335 [Blattella germanica]|nr:hypothetical protein C0J52_12335 [Blattella germanica]
MNYSGNNNGNYENCFDISRNESLFEDAYNFPSSSEKDEKLVPDSDVTMLTSFSCSSSMDFSGNFFDVGVGRGIAQRSSKSSSTVSTPGNSGRNTPGNSGRNTPSSLVDNGGQMWDYFSEIKNATNNSFNRNNTCEMDVQNMHDSSETVDTSIQSEPIDDTSFSEDPIVKCCDNSGQFLDCSADENKIIGCDGKELSAHSDTNVLCSTSDGKCSVDDKTEDKNILPNKERLGHKKDDDECRVQEVQNRKNRRIIRGNFVSDVLIISDPNPVPPPVTENKSEEATPASNGVITKRKKVRHKSESASSPKLQSPEKQKSPSSPATLTLNPDECTWDMMYDDNGECLDPKLMEELTSSVGSVAIEKPQSDYRSYQSRFELIMSGAADDEFSHVLEIYNFPPEFKTQDLYAVFSPYTKAGFEIKWVDDTHALGVFSSATVAADVLATDHPFVKTRPLQQATHDSRMKARRSAEFLQPYRARPETCPALARRLVTGALGVKLSTSREEREAERKILKEAREKKRLAARQRDEAWEGTIGAENKELS